MQARPRTKQAFEKLLDKMQGSLKGSGVLRSLMEERRRDREREDPGWTRPQPPHLR